MPTIDQTKLRRYYRAAKDTHAALMAASEGVRHQRKDIADLKFRMELASADNISRDASIDAPDPAPQLLSDRVPYDWGGTEPITGTAPAYKSRALRDVAKPGTRPNTVIVALSAEIEAASAALARATERYDEASEAWEHAQGLWSRCKAYAEAHSALPADLQN